MKKWYCRECEMNGIKNYYDSKEELLKAHPALENAKDLVAFKNVDM